MQSHSWGLSMSTMTINFRNRSTGMVVMIKADDSYNLVGNNPDSVTDDELCDMVAGHVPHGWERMLPPELESLTPIHGIRGLDLGIKEL